MLKCKTWSWYKINMINRTIKLERIKNLKLTCTFFYKGFSS